MKPIKGLYLDCLPDDQPEGTYRNARNILLGKLNKAVANEDGFEMFCDLTFNAGQASYPITPAYVLAIDNDEYIILGRYDHPEQSQGSQIGRVRSDGTYEPILTCQGLKFYLGKSFKAIFMRNFKGELVIAWTDGTNPPRILNLDSLPFPQQSLSGTLLVREDLLVLSELFPRFNPYSITFRRRIDSGGSLLSGAYYLAVSYETPDGGKTNWGSIAGPFMVTDDLSSRGANSYDGCEAGTMTGKSIEVELGNLDTRYRYYNVAVIKRINGNYTASQVGRRLITGGTDTYTYTGGEVETPLLLEEVLAGTSYFTKAKTLTQLENRLYLANLDAEQPINYQQYANGIKVDWVTDRVSLGSVTGSYKDEVVIYNKRGFFPDETYALYIAFLLDSNGTRSQAFHIPGREAREITFEGHTFMEDASIKTLIQENPGLSLLKDDLGIDQAVKFFHTRETAKGDGTMGFWENESESYPDHPDWDIRQGSQITGSLRNRKVRHHKMPSIPMLVETGHFEEPEMKDPLKVALAFEKQITNPTGQTYGGIEVYQEGLQFSGDISEFGSWDASTLTYTATKDHSIVLRGDYRMEANASTNWNDNVDCYSQSAFAIYKKVGVVTETILEDYDSQDDPYSAEGSPASTNASSYNTVNKTITLRKDDQLMFTISCSAMGTYWAASAVFTLNFEMGELAGFEGIDGVGVTAKIIGIRVSNIQIPAELKSRVKGFEIFYAKRNAANMRAVGNSAIFHYQNQHVLNSGNLGPAAGSRVSRSGALDFTTGRFHAFDLLKDHVAVAPSHIKLDMNLRTETTMEGGAIALSGESKPDDSTPVQAVYLTNFVKPGVEVNPISSSNRVRTVSNFTYIPGDTVINVEGDVMDNTWGEEHAFFKVNHPYSYPHQWGASSGVFPTNSVNFPESVNIATLYQHKVNVYNSLFNQELVSTGAVRIVTGEGNYAVDRVFGGDTTLNRYGIRISAPIYLSQTHYSTNKFEAIKGIYFFPVYSVNNIDLRHEGKELKDSYFPKVGVGTDSYFKWAKRAVDAPNSNSFHYNPDYTAVNDLQKVYPFDSMTEFVDRFPYRIIRSKAYNPESKEFTLRSFLANDYFEMVKTRGEITNIEAYGETLMINTKASIFRTIGNEVLKTSTTEITLGSGDIFRMPPKELITSEGGYAGCQHMSSCFVSKLGYFFADAEQGKVFLVSGDLKEISNNGMRRWFQDHCNHLEVPDGMDAPNDPDKAGFTVAFDEKYNRLIFGIRGINNAYTLSYSPENEMWVCWHDYFPGFLRNSRRSLVSVHESKMYRHNVKGHPGRFHMNIINPSYIDVVFNPSPETTKLFGSLTWRTRTEGASGESLPRETFSDILVWDSRHCSGYVPLVNMVNIRDAEGEWRFNDFRDLVADPDQPFMDEDLEPVQENIDPEKPWFKQGKFIDNYLMVRLQEKNIRKNTIYLYSIDANYRVSDR